MKAAIHKRIIALMVLLYILSIVSFANGGKIMESPRGNGGVYFDENPDVELIDESISFYSIESGTIPKAKVVVEYNIKSTTNNEQKFNMLFIISHIEKEELEGALKVNLDNEDITVSSTYMDIETPDNWNPVFNENLVEPYSKEVYDDYFISNMNIVQGKEAGIEIPISINSESSSKLTIEYITKGGYYKGSKYVRTVNSFIYYLTPAKYWKGQPKVKLNVNLPHTTSKGLNSNIPMKEISKGSFTAELNGLPEHEWVFTFIDNSGLIYGTNNAETNRKITIVISMVILIAFIAAYMKYKKGYLVMLGYITALAYFFCFVGKLVDGGIGDGLILIFLVFVLGIIVPTIYFTSRLVRRSYFEKK